MVLVVVFDGTCMMSVGGSPCHAQTFPNILVPRSSHALMFLQAFLFFFGDVVSKFAVLSHSRFIISNLNRKAKNPVCVRVQTCM